VYPGIERREMTGVIRMGKTIRIRWTPKAPPNNRLEPLKRDRQGQHSIRINDQFRVCFVWGSDGPVDVELVDYH